MKHKLQTLFKHNCRTLLLLLTLITASQEVWGYNEYNRDIIYIDAKDFTSFYNDGCKADLAVYNNWNCNSGEYKYSALSRLGNDTYVSYHSIKDTYGKSNARGFKVARCDNWYNWTGNLGRENGSSDNCIKINGWGSGYWSKYVLEPTSVSLTVTDAKSGSGTSDDPYIVDAGASFTLSATPVYPITDSYMVTRYYFGTNDYNTPTSETSTSTQTASSSGGVTTRYYVSARGSYENTYTNPATHVSASVYVLTETAATFAEGDVIWLDINHSGNDGWGVTSDERMYVNLDPSNNTTTRAMTKVAQNTNEKNSLWVYRFTAADQSLNKSAIKFQRGNSSTGRWDLSAEFKASDLTSYNGIYINNDGWQGVGTKFNFTTSNNVVSTPTLTMKDGAGSGEISSCTSGETVKFYESTQTITTTISGTSEARTLINPLYTYTFSKGSYSSGQTIDNPHSWTTSDTYLGSGTAKVKITFAIDGGATPTSTSTPASSISSGYAKESEDEPFTVNPSCTTPSVSTNSTPSSVSATSATLSGTVTEGGCSGEAGIVYSSTSTTPTVGGSGCTNVSTSYTSGEEYDVTLDNTLTAGTKYYYRAYFTVSGTTYYDNTVYSFYTKPANLYIKGLIIDSGSGCSNPWPFDPKAFNVSGNVFTKAIIARHPGCSYGGVNADAEFVLSTTQGSDNGMLNGKTTFDSDGATPNWAYSKRSGAEENFKYSEVYSAGDKLLITVTFLTSGKFKMKMETLNCSTPDSKTISITGGSCSDGSAATVTVSSAQDGYLYTVYDALGVVVGNGVGGGSNLDMSVTPTYNTTYTVKAKEYDVCETETEMGNTVNVTMKPRFNPSTNITPYVPITVTSTAATPAWTFNKVSGSLTGAWLSNGDGVSTVFKAPTGTYTVSDGTCNTANIVIGTDSNNCN